MEQILAASSAKLIDSLDYSSLPGVADYIQSRSQIQIFPEGGNQYSPTGVKQIRFRLATSGPFIDCSSIAIQAKVTNKSSSHGLVILGPNLGTMVQEARV